MVYINKLRKLNNLFLSFSFHKLPENPESPMSESWQGAASAPNFVCSSPESEKDCEMPEHPRQERENKRRFQTQAGLKDCSLNQSQAGAIHSGN